ncbi:hypothetical protein [Fibrobacter sp. UWB10]|uniref:hypothetical protein n=1 Tax=Fibrobacter sp. UWB10 TaxID=1896201 RepID=UPI002402E48F|nr:hypothetical protein [Fibrobacter sp. UWB10]SMP45802.1 hypothetical protein SAMN05720465_1122 [Fibrobacter sp. UWB10]
MEPTEPLFAIIAKIVLIIIFAIIPFVFGIFVNISTKHRKPFLIAGRVVSILSAIFIAVGHSVVIAYSIVIPMDAWPFYVYACCFCGLTMGVLPLSTFYFTTSKKSKKRRACYLAISFIAFSLILSGYEASYNRAYGKIAYQTERQDLSINDFYANHPEADKNGEINVSASLYNGGEWLTANISVYKDSIVLKTKEHHYDISETDSCYRNDLPPNQVQDIIEEIIYYEPEIEYSQGKDMCLHPSATIELADNKKATTVKLLLPDLDGYHPNAQRLVKKINNLIKDSKFDPTKGCRND